MRRHASRSANAAAIVVERAHAHALLAEQVEIDIGDRGLVVLGEALGLRQDRAVFVDAGLTVPGKIGGGLAGAGRGVEIGRHAARRLRHAQHAPRVRLADGDVAGRQVGEHRRAGQRGASAGRHRHPEVLADFGMHDQIGQVFGGEQQVGAERRRWYPQTMISLAGDAGAGDEMARARRIPGSWA